MVRHPALKASAPGQMFWTGSNMTTWSKLSEELGRWAEEGCRANLWWRDDDAMGDGPKFRRLVAMAKTNEVPLALAVIPGGVKDNLKLQCADFPELAVLVHGLKHKNLAPFGEKKSEFGPYRPVKEMLEDVAAAFEILKARFPNSTYPVFVPPWNRIDPELVACLPKANLLGLSRFGPRMSINRIKGLNECNCHVDLIDWRGKRNFVGQEMALDALISHLCARRTGAVDAGEATGILSHHNVMDDNSWKFLEELFDRTKGGEGARWLNMNQIFNLNI